MKSVHIAAFVLAALVAVPPRASAGPGDAKVSADAEASAREHFRRGQRLSVRGDYEAAYREFAAGYALTERPLFLFNMAEAARASGDVARARESYLQFLRLDPKNALAATAQARLAELDRAGGPSTVPGPGSASPGASASSTAGAAPTAGASPTAANKEAPAAAGTTPGSEPAAVRAVPPPHQVAPPSSTGTPASPQGSPLRDGPEATESTPVWKQWPLWAVVGGVVAGSVVLYAATRDGGPCSGGCTEIDFR